MSEFDPYKIPIEKEYEEFFIAHDDELLCNGGIASVLQKYEYSATHNSETIFDHIIKTGVVALLLEPTGVRGRTIDPLMLSTHAFKRGMLMGFNATGHVYNDQIHPGEIRDAIKTGFHHQELYGQAVEQLEENALLGWGRQGLDTIGPVSRHIAGQWSRVISDDLTRQHLFLYGIGVTIATGEAIMMNRGMNALDAHFNSPDWSHELDQILAPNTGE